MGHIEWLRKEIDGWCAEGLVPEETATKLLERYPLETSRHSWGIILVGTFGALLIGLGVIALLAANWENLGRPARTAIAIAPIVACGIAALVATQREHKGRIFWEVLGILWNIAIVAAVCLVAQTYQLGASVPGLILLVALLSLTVIWATGSVIPMVFWPIYVPIWLMATHDETGDPKGLWLTIRGLLLFCAGIPAYIAFLRNRPPRPAFLTAQVFTGLSFANCLGIILAYSLEISFLHNYGVEETILCFWFSAGLLALAAWKWKLPAWRIIATLIAAFFAQLTPFSHLCNISLFFLALLLALALIAYGVRKLRLVYMNIGVCLLLWHILVKFLSSELDFTVKGLILLACGIALTASNALFVRYRKHVQEGHHEQEA